MDESWRKSMGVSASGTSTGGTALEPEDFNDVFGGPPRSVLARKMSADFSGNDWFYNEIFKPPSDFLDSQAIISGRKLPEFVIPDRRLSKNRQVKSMSRSKSTSSSVMSFDEMNELNNFRSAAVIGEEDVVLSTYTSKLRPLNVPSRWTSSSKPKTNHKKQDLPAYGCPKSSLDNKFIANECNDYMIQYHQSIPSPNTKNFEHSFKVNVNGEYDMQLSPNSPVVPPHQGRTTNYDYEECLSYQQPSYVGSEVNNQMVEGSNSEEINIAEAIAWAKEKFHG
ncbi:uncharacterized protein LOC110728430 [Chenopodium quinoa]|uniref:Uncharacterized protein n=1 Tax=Chenopodium quinoa TaxID=63459 RepID=A0A803MIP0_CHEQI|nr:uncharacterized protein LOC110728430 [Chenopodium quinoa]